MKIKGFFCLLLLAGCGLMANAMGQSVPPPNIGPLTFNLNGSSGTFVIPNINGQSYCVVTVPSTATMGGGTLTMKVSADNGSNYFAVTGLPDLGSGSNPSQTIGTAGTQLTAPVSGKTNFEVVLSGASGAAITGTVTCGYGSGALGSAGGGGGSATNATIVAPTDANGNVKVISQNSPLPSIGPGGYPGVTIADPNGTSFPAITPTSTPSAAVPMIPVVAALYGQCGTSGLMCPISAAGQAATGAARNPLNVVLCNNTASTCQIVTGTGADAIANTSMGAMNVSSFHYAFNGSTWDRVREAGSPAPVGVVAGGFNAAGAAAPVVCTHSATVLIAATTQATETVIVPSAASKVIYVCSVTMFANSTAQGNSFGLASSATNTCGSLTSVYAAMAGLSTAGAGNSSAGTGVGTVAQTSAGTALCFYNALASPSGSSGATIMYEQFLHDLSAEEINDFCSIPKRCLLYGLYRRMEKVMDMNLIPR